MIELYCQKENIFLRVSLIHNKTVDEFGAEVWDLICIGEYIPFIEQTTKALEDLKEMLSLV